MAYNLPNRNKPRVRLSASIVMTEKEFRNFIISNPEYKGLTLTQFNEIIRKFNLNIISEVLENRDGVSLPERLGNLFIVSFTKAKNRKIIDFGKSNIIGKTCYHANWDTDGMVGKIIYQKSKTIKIENGRLWGLMPTRNFKKSMSLIFKDLWQKFIHIDKRHGLGYN